jgi:hypothetical protein
MGKPSRRPNRRERPRRIRYVANGPELKVVIATTPRSDSQSIDLRSEVALTKAALLYADKVELVSPAATIVGSVASFADASDADVLELLASLDKRTLAHFGMKEMPANWKEIVLALTALGSLTPADQRALLGEHATPEVLDLARAARDGLAGPAQDLRDATAGLVERSGGRELEEPLALGLVTVNPVGVDIGGSVDDMVARYVDHVKEILRDPTAHAMFDEATASLARSLVAGGHVEPRQITLVHAQEAAVGGGLVARLPTFPDARMSDVIALRTDLTGPLSRYRRAVAGFTDKLRSQAFDAEASAEVDDLWRSTVAPSLDGLQDQLREHSFIREVARQVAATPTAVSIGVASAGALFVGMQSAHAIESMIGAAGGATPVAAAALHTAAKAASASRRGKAEARGHDLFYLHEVNRRL